jgi:hypothetical protein
MMTAVSLELLGSVLSGMDDLYVRRRHGRVVLAALVITPETPDSGSMANRDAAPIFSEPAST